MDWSEYSSEKFKWLDKRAYNTFTQCGEDGLIQAIFERIGETNRYCCEFGAADGLWFSNSRRLIEQGWSGLLIEADSEPYQKLEARYANNPNITTVQAFVEPHGENSIDNLLERAGAPYDLDLLSIDIDGQDYYIFNGLWKYQPRVVICEYAPHFESMFIPELGGPGQAGDRAILNVGVARGYMPVCKTRYNYIFVRADLLDLLVEEPVVDSSLVRLCAVMSTPRLGFLTTSDCIYAAVAALGAAFLRGEGAYWSQSLTSCLEEALGKGANYILSIDYDSAFSVDDIKRLVCHLHDNPEVDVVVPIQLKREGGEPLLTTKGAVDLRHRLIPIQQGHFGLTMFRSSVFERLSKPWFKAVQDPNGGWGEGRTDADIYFWKNCRKNKVKAAAATDVVIGHIEQVITWPGQDFKPVHQTLNDWRKIGKPVEAFHKPPAETAPKKKAMAMK